MKSGKLVSPWLSHVACPSSANYPPGIDSAATVPQVTAAQKVSFIVFVPLIYLPAVSLPSKANITIYLSYILSAEHLGTTVGNVQYIPASGRPSPTLCTSSTVPTLKVTRHQAHPFGARLDSPQSYQFDQVIRWRHLQF